MDAATQHSIPVPEPDLTPEDMIARAQAMIPILRERSERTEEARQLLDETFEDFMNAGFYRVVQPRRLGGYEFDTLTMARTMSAIARGCSASAWVLCLTAGHTKQLARFPEHVQFEAAGKDGDFRAPYQAFPGAKARPVEGGFMVTGGWDYTSGCDHSNYFMGNAIVLSENGGPPRIIAPMMPMQDATIVDNWDPLGQRGTGSKRVCFEDQFVPTDWAPDTPGFIGFGSPIHQNALYQAPFLPFAVLELASLAVGTARGCLDLFDEFMRTKVLKNARRALATEDVTIRQTYSRATAICDVAEAALMQCARDYMSLGEKYSRGELESETEAELRMIIPLQQITRHAAEVVSMLFVAAGTSATMGNHPIQRVFRDMSVLRTHVAASLETRGEQWAAVHFGVDAYYPVGVAQ